MHFQKQHTEYYLSLIVLLGLGTLLVFGAAPDKEFQTLIIVLTTVFYVGWGIVHHIINHDSTSKIVIEYVLIGSLGLTLVLFFLKGGIGL